MNTQDAHTGPGTDLVGRTALLEIKQYSNTLFARVRITSVVDLRRSFGISRVVIEPVSGTGEAIVNLSRLKLEEVDA